MFLCGTHRLQAMMQSTQSPAVFKCPGKFNHVPLSIDFRRHHAVAFIFNESTPKKPVRKLVWKYAKWHVGGETGYLISFRFYFVEFIL